MSSRSRVTLKETNFRQEPGEMSSNKPSNDFSVVASSWTTRSNNKFPESLVLQAQIRDTKIWAKYKCQKMDLLFDMHAIIDSDIENNDLNGKMFTIRDATDSVLVTYYEIDCEMPKVKKGDWVRLGCTPRPWGFQATSVQKAASGFLTGFYDKLVGSRITLERKVAELNL